MNVERIILTDFFRHNPILIILMVHSHWIFVKKSSSKLTLLKEIIWITKDITYFYQTSHKSYNQTKRASKWAYEILKYDFRYITKKAFFHISTMISKVNIYPCEIEIILNSLLKLYANVIYNDVEILWTFHKVSWIIFVDIALQPVKFH